MFCVTQQLGSQTGKQVLRKYPCDGLARAAGSLGIAIYTLEADAGELADADHRTTQCNRTSQSSSCSSEDFSTILAAYSELCSASVESNGHSGKSKLSSGRGVTSLIPLAGSSQGIMRLYRRGGMLARVVSQTFVAAGEPRPVRELVVLGHLRASGAAVPEPCAAVVRPATGGWMYGNWIYGGALVTRYLPTAINLLDVLRELDSTQLAKLCRQVGGEARRNLLLGVYQPDLHLGNVLIEPESLSPILIDFDKARWNQMKPEAMYSDASIKTLIDRWQRSAQKHLNAAARELTEAFEQGIRGELR